MISAANHVAFVLLAVGGCAIYGGGGGIENPNTDDPSPTGTQRLGPITFSPFSQFPQADDSVELDVGEGTVSFAGGEAGTVGQPGLYADDSVSWIIRAGDAAMIQFEGLEVLAVDGYFVHPNVQINGATLIANFSGGSSEMIASASVNASGPLGQANGFFPTVSAPDGETIVSLVFQFGTGGAEGDIVVLDVLELTVPAE